MSKIPYPERQRAFRNHKLTPYCENKRNEKVMFKEIVEHISYENKDGIAISSVKTHRKKTRQGRDSEKKWARHQGKEIIKKQLKELENDKI